MEIDKLLNKNKIMLNLKAETKDEAIDKLCDILLSYGDIADKNEFLSDVMRRENVSSTAIGNKIAIPHGKSHSVKNTSIAIGVIDNEKLKWETFDNKPVKIVILLAVNDEDKQDIHLKILSQMAKKLAIEEVCDRLCNAKCEQEIIDILKE